MRSLELARTGFKQAVSKTMGVHLYYPRYLEGNKKVENFLSEFYALPAVISDPVQILDPDDPDFGKLIFIADRHTIDGDNPVY